MIQRVFPALLVCAALLVPASAGATIAVKLDVDALSTTADTIVLGRVASKQARWEGQRIVTDYAVEVAMPVIGSADAGSTLTVQTLGGRVDDLAQVVHGTPGFVVGEDVLLFLQKVRPAAPLRVVGMAQGRFKVERDANGDIWATQDLTGLGLAQVVAVDGNGKTSAKLLDHQEPMRMPLRSLLTQVAGSLSRVDVVVRPEVTGRLGQKLDKPYDFRLELGGVRK